MAMREARLEVDGEPVAEDEAGLPNESPCARVARRGYGRVVGGVWRTRAATGARVRVGARAATGACVRVVAGITAGARAPRPVDGWMRSVLFS